ncbi:hypothetical protein BGX28_002956 [Mortierella sp. GBA30]|nr:hypothetical protein BGX28_002956 [Mortierella sp. GBA30]
MASAVPSLQNEANCNEYTAAVDHDSLVPSSTQTVAHSDSVHSPAHSALMPQLMSDTLLGDAVKYLNAGLGSESISVWLGSVTGRLTSPEHDQESISSSLSEHPSPTSSVFTPASTPCSESDDSVLIDSLSPPLSPWFPSMLQTATDTNQDIGTTTKTVVSRPDLDFFNNSFYQTLCHQSFRRRKTPIANAVRDTIRSKTTTAENNRTAAPADLFNVTIDQILSADPLHFDLTDTSVPMEEESEAEATLRLKQVSSTLSSQDLDSATILAQAQELSGDESVSSQDFEVEDKDDLDYTESSSRRRRTTAATNIRSRSQQGGPVRRCRPTKEKSHRVKKDPVKKVPKIYPQRQTKNYVSVDDDNDGQMSFAVSPSSDGGYLCEHCPQERFGRVHDLKRHQISKHNERTWPCDFCRRPFVRRDALLRHYSVKAARNDGIHPSAGEKSRLSEARARARLI